MKDEMNSITSKETYEVVQRPKGRRIIPVRRVYVVNLGAIGNIIWFKSRVVAKGFKQVEGIDFNATDAPVCHQVTRRVLLAIATAQKLHMHQMDVKTA